MPEHRTPCPSTRQLSDYGLGKLSAPEASAIHAHLARCPSCRQKLGVQPPDTLIGNMRADRHAQTTIRPTADARDSNTVIPRHSPLAAAPLHELPAELAASRKFEIVGKLGAGGMGAVWKARHKFLDELVAADTAEMKSRPLAPRIPPPPDPAQVVNRLPQDRTETPPPAESHEKPSRLRSSQGGGHRWLIYSIGLLLLAGSLLAAVVVVILGKVNQMVEEPNVASAPIRETLEVKGTAPAVPPTPVAPPQSAGPPAEKGQPEPAVPPKEGRRLFLSLKAWGTDPSWALLADADRSSYESWLELLRSRDYRPVHVNTHALADQLKYSPIAAKDGRKVAWESISDVDGKDYQKAFDEMRSKGLLPVTVSGHTLPPRPAGTFAKEIRSLQSLGFRPIPILGHQQGTESRYHSVWVKTKAD
jgi:hypothetical protein